MPQNLMELKDLLQKMQDAGASAATIAEVVGKYRDMQTQAAADAVPADVRAANRASGNLRDQLAKETDPAKRKALQAQLAAGAPKQTSPDTFMGGVAEAMKPGGASDVAAGKSGKAFLENLPHGALVGLVGAFPALFEGVINAGEFGIEAMTNPTKAADKIWNAVKNAPADAKQEFDHALTLAAADPEAFGKNVGDVTGATIGGLSAFPVAGAASRMPLVRGAATAVAEHTPVLGGVIRLGRNVSRAAQAAADAAEAAAPEAAAAKAAAPVAEAAAAEGSAAGAAAPGPAFNPRQPWTIEDMIARNKARQAAADAGQLRPKTKVMPNGNIRVTGYLPGQTAAEAKAAIAAREGEATDLLTKGRHVGGDYLSPDMARSIGEKADEMAAQGAEFDRPVKHNITQAEIDRIMAEPPSEGISPAQYAKSQEMNPAMQRFTNANQRVTADELEQVMKSGGGEPPAGAAPSGGPAPTPEGPQSFEDFLMQQEASQPSFTHEGEAVMPGDTMPTTAAGNTPAPSKFSKYPATKSKTKSDLIPHLSLQDELLLRQNPDISAEDLLAERQFRSNMYRAGQDLSGTQ